MPHDGWCSVALRFECWLFRERIFRSGSIENIWRDRLNTPESRVFVKGYKFY